MDRKYACGSCNIWTKENIQINIKNNLPIIRYIIYISSWSVCVSEIILEERVSGERKCKIHFLNCDQKLMFKCSFAYIFKKNMDGRRTALCRLRTSSRQQNLCLLPLWEKYMVYKSANSEWQLQGFCFR